jgi:multidrug efflux pump
VFSKFFIERQVFAIVVSLLIVIAGLVSLWVLPVSLYPEMTPVQIQVTTTYPGADSKTVGTSVAAPIEAQINGVDNMLYMTSISSNTGQMTITVYFTPNTDPDIAQVLVQNRVTLAMPQLPAAVVQYGVSVQKKSANVMMIVALYDKEGRYTPEYVTNYTNVYILDALKRIDGAGQAQIFGVPDQAMRIWTNPRRMASLDITSGDIANAVSAQNALVSAGQVNSEPNSGKEQLTIPLITQAPFTDPARYEDIILRASPDGSAVVRLRDVARAEVGRRQYIDYNELNGAPSTPIVIYQQPGANGLQVSAAVRKMMEELKSSFPPGIEYKIALDTNDFVRISIDEVIHTLLEALVLVVAVVYLFLQSLRATLICTIAIMVSLIGTFTGMLILGFSINLLTLFGMVLAIGIVVDDAIVVVENVERNMEQNHLSPKDASIKGMQEVTGPVIAVVLVMAAVFVPAAFLPGTTGQLYKQFALTIALSVAISGFVALTLTPAMSATLLKHRSPPQRGPFAWFNRWFERVTKSYGRSVQLVIKRMLIASVPLAIMIWGIYALFRVLPTSFVPNEDQGYVFAQLVMPDSATLKRTVATSGQIDALFAKRTAVADRTIINGYSLIDGQYKPNVATFFVTLADFKKRYESIATARKENAKAVLLGVYGESRKIDTGSLIPIAPPAIPGLGTSGGFEFWIQDKTTAADPLRLGEITQKFIAAAAKRPELGRLNTTFRGVSRQMEITVDGEKARLLGLPIKSVDDALQAQFGSLVVSQFTQYSRVWNVIMQADARYRQNPDDISKLYARSTNGQMIPLSAVVSTKYVVGPDLVPHFNGFPAAQIIGGAAPGYSSGDAIGAMQQAADEVLPAGYGYGWSGTAFQEIRAGSTSAFAFAFGVLIVFLILAAMYGSWSLPGSVLTAVPFGIIGALLANWARGLENDVYFQIGLLVLVALAAKNAILIVEFAVELRHQGRSALEAAVEAGELRLRPIIMTSLAFIIGCVPLAIAVGAGANARHSIGTGIIGGMLGASSLALLYVPLFFYLFDKLAEPGGEHGGKPAAGETPAAGGTALDAPHARHEGD